jgi:hypothetical protein
MLLLFGPWSTAEPPAEPAAGLSLQLIIEVGRGNNGKSLRRTLINQEHVVACYTHSDLVSDYGSYDISRIGNNGTYEGTDYVRGITVDDLAEGGIATRFDSTQQIRVPDDGLNGGRNLSLAAGSFDIYIYFRTSVDDANQRALITKYDDSSVTGWQAYLQNGAFVGKLYVSSTLVFSITRGAVCDGEWHRVHLCYTPEDPVDSVRVNIDGVQSGATIAATTEPIYNPADMIICGWDHLSSTSNRFIGDLHYVMIGREGYPALGAEAEAAIEWYDISDYVLSMEVQIGDSNEIALGSTAGTGKASFELRNDNPLGLFSTGHANALSGFGLANPIRIRTNDGTTIRPLFRGFISDLVPTTGERGDRRVAVDCVDWLEVLAVSPIGPVPVLIGKESDYCLRLLLDQTNRPPASVDIDTGNEIFPFAFDQIDSVQGKILQEVAEIVRCEGGAAYVKRDGTFRVEARQRRQIPIMPVLTLDNHWQEMDAGMGLHNIINTQRATVYPREPGPDTDTVVVGSISPGSIARRQLLVPGDIVPLEGTYSDPEERSISVGAIDLQVITPVTDYTMTTNEDGTGDDLTAYVSFISGNPPDGGNSYSVQVVNTHPSLQGWFHMQVRGRILRRFDPVGTYYEDLDSQNEFLPREPPALNLRYVSDIEGGRSRCMFLVNMYKNQKIRPRKFMLTLGD